jgi:hypothetical protein
MAIAIEPKLVAKALAVSGERTKKAVIEKALREFIASCEQKRILELVGKLDWDPTYDYKKERGRSEKHRRLKLFPETDE